LAKDRAADSTPLLSVRAGVVGVASRNPDYVVRAVAGDHVLFELHDLVFRKIGAGILVALNRPEEDHGGDHAVIVDGIYALVHPLKELWVDLDLLFSREGDLAELVGRSGPPGGGEDELNYAESLIGPVFEVGFPIGLRSKEGAVPAGIAEPEEGFLVRVRQVEAVPRHAQGSVLHQG